jgi:hypothetical protein
LLFLACGHPAPLQPVSDSSEVTIAEIGNGEPTRSCEGDSFRVDFYEDLATIFESAESLGDPAPGFHPIADARRQNVFEDGADGGGLVYTQVTAYELFDGTQYSGLSVTMLDNYTPRRVVVRERRSDLGRVLTREQLVCDR